MDKRVEAPWNYSWIIPGYLVGTSCPCLIENLKFFKEEGVTHLITLSPEYKPATINFPGIKWSYIPIEEFEAPSLKDIKKFVKLCEEAKDHNEAVAIHCRVGRGRTGTMAACYLVRFMDLSPERAITQIRFMRPGSVETYLQEKAVFKYWDYVRSVESTFTKHPS